MEDFQVIIYVLFAIIWFVIKILGKKGKPVTRRPEEEVVNQEMRNPERRPVRPNTPTTFEDLLKEFGGGVETQEEELEEDYNTRPSRQTGRSQEVANPWETPQEYQNSWEVKTPVYENLEKQGDEEVQRRYEDSIKAANRIQTIDEAVSLESSSIQIGKIPQTIDSSQNNAFSRSILEELKDPEGAKKAIVLAEIFNRRY